MPLAPPSLQMLANLTAAPLVLPFAVLWDLAYTTHLFSVSLSAPLSVPRVVSSQLKWMMYALIISFQAFQKSPLGSDWPSQERRRPGKEAAVSADESSCVACLPNEK